MRLRDLIRIALRLDLRRLMDLPDWKDSADLQAWCISLCEAGDTLADLTVIERDDEIFQALRALVAHKEAWAEIHIVIMRSLADEMPLPMIGGKAVAEKVGINPATIMLVVEAIVFLLKWLRDRRKQQ